MIFVIDASVAVKWFAKEDGVEASRYFLKPELQRVAPELMLIEVMNVLCRKIRTGQLAEFQAAAAAATIAPFFDALLPTEPLLEHSFRISRQLNHSIYDCVYLAVALSAPDGLLITADRKFESKAIEGGFGDNILNLEAAYARFRTSQENEHG